MERIFYLKYKDKEEIIRLTGYSISYNVILLKHPNVEENLSGFLIYSQDGTLVKDCSDFIYRWDVLEDNNNKIYYTNSPDNVQTMKFNTDDQEEEVEPLNNRELTEAVADIIYELSVTQLGLQ